MEQRPTIISTIRFIQPNGYGGFQILQKRRWIPVNLYAWSDGIVTWTTDRGF